MTLKTYIDSGAIECCLLGLATAEEQAMLEQMRYDYPELESEISVVAYRLEQAALDGAVPPPAEVWNQLSRRVHWEVMEEQQRGRRNRHQANYTVINLQEPPQHRYIQVSIWWRCIVIAMCVVMMALLASNIYFYRKYHEMEERLLRAYPASQLAPSTK
ncbi:hypothetical protein F0L74_04160 [Chitinophaga agrisoli]|uniref:Uncharacterized protein n=1 Tax=Chitinophaga agrisoli TaxID=2607653 RepID=A0A5B2VZA5_9BACT|nr:hypothetical protein [Chitinophaga agrisoli]KAA2245163.1 hypothetical protein F0L74_04160 [Chitinophaga agrisoli]